jgi:hypothetical protein
MPADMSKANRKLGSIPVVKSGSKYVTEAGFFCQGRHYAAEAMDGRERRFCHGWPAAAVRQSVAA